MSDEEFQVSLVVTGFDSNPNEITKRLKIEPTITHKVGEVKRKDPNGVHAPVLYKENIWCLKTELPKSANLDAHLIWLLNKIRPNVTDVQYVTSKYQAEILIGADYYDSHTGLHLDKDIVKELSDYGLALDFDAYTFNKSYLDEPNKRERLAGILQKVAIIGELNEQEHTESRALVELLTTFEEVSPHIVAALSDLFWDALDEPELAERLIVIRQALQRLEKSMQKSHFLQDGSADL